MTNADLTARTATSQATVERCLAELRRGGAIALMDGDDAILAVAAENLEESVFAWLNSAAGTDGVRLLLTAERAGRLGLKTNPADTAGGEAVCICHLTADLAAEAVKGALIHHVADPTSTSQPAGALDTAVLDLALDEDPDRSLSSNLRHGAIDLAKTARLLPAMVVARVPAAAVAYWVASPFTMDHADLATHRRMLASQLRRVGSARVPLEGAEQTEIIAFRPSDGGKEHLAIVIGRPDPDQPVLIRLHSECFTGDLLGSLRCDCGDQLRGAIEQIAKSGSGILLYLAQEGRGIGLINKLRAYRLQDAGADTLDANLQLGFGADERVYQPAAEMLRQLGIVAVRLLTNNPDKVKGLEHCGIRVTERVAHAFPSNDHNARYLSTKATRFGHMF
ncbi:GTP cyclohydrolase II [Dongia soli]|uniref:GTP cyclohydrolase-2 n=1 Tax=Dongia soli TaxID=600628 RepID=A0ABU5E714_9PROT|nr:GTP cyclohydrolase II [Dongia soli]MDY0881939.1 GTP cyclohydrolase II [Dongia soli]